MSESHYLQQLKPGILVDDYYLIRELGRGGMGCVFLAQRKQLQFAIKFQQIDGAEARLRFQREAQLLAKVDQHPNIARIFQLKLEAPIPYIVFEYLEGIDLKSAIQSNELNTKERLQISREIIAGLAHIHKNGIIHRDIKPANVMLRVNAPESPQRYQAVWVDFGLAWHARQQHLTQTGEILGTPAYLSPEQCLGQKLTAASDVFSLGLLLAELITGKRVIQGNTIVESINSILGGKYQIDWTHAAPELFPVQLIAEKCLSSEVQSRPSSAIAVEEQLLSNHKEQLREQALSQKLIFLGVLALLLCVASLLYTVQFNNSNAEAEKRLSSFMKNIEIRLEGALLQKDLSLICHDSSQQQDLTIAQELQDDLKRLRTRKTVIAVVDNSSDRYSLKQRFSDLREIRANSEFPTAQLIRNRDYEAAAKAIQARQVAQENQALKRIVLRALQFRQASILENDPSKRWETAESKQNLRKLDESFRFQQLCRDYLRTQFPLPGTDKSARINLEAKISRQIRRNPDRKSPFQFCVMQQLTDKRIQAELRTDLFINLLKQSKLLSELPQAMTAFAQDCNPSHLLQENGTKGQLRPILDQLIKRAIAKRQNDSQAIPSLHFVVRSYAVLDRRGEPHELDFKVFPQNLIDNWLNIYLMNSKALTQKSQSKQFGATVNYSVLEFCIDLFRVNRTPIDIYFKILRFIRSQNNTTLDEQRENEKVFFFAIAGVVSDAPTQSKEFSKPSLQELLKVLKDQQQTLKIRPLAFAYARLTTLATDLESYEQVLDFSGQAIRMGHPTLPQLYSQRCLALVKLGRLEEAKEAATLCQEWTDWTYAQSKVGAKRPATPKKLGPAFLEIQDSGIETRQILHTVRPLLCKTICLIGEKAYQQALEVTTLIRKTLESTPSPGRALTEVYIENALATIQCLTAMDRRTEAAARLKTTHSRYSKAPQYRQLMQSLK